MRDFAPGEGVGARGRHGGLGGPVDVPGDVHTALVAAGRIEDPFYDRNEDACAWMEEREWWYRVELRRARRRRRPASGCGSSSTALDTFATVFLNGRELGRHANMFREAAFDVTGQVRPGARTCSRSASTRRCAHAGPRDPEQWSSTPAERVWMRKAQFGFGWDWGPRLPTIGIWRPVELRTRAARRRSRA